MSRRVPEFALVTGAFLALTLFVAGVAFTPELALSTIVAGAVLYGFAAYAVLTDDDPTTVLPPWLVLVVGAVLGVAGFAAVLVTRATPLSPRVFLALLLALGFALPAAAYYVHFTRASLLPPAPTATAGVALGALLALVGLLGGAALYAAAAGTLVALAATLYANARGHRPTRARKRLAVLGGVGFGLAAAGGGVAAGVPLADALVVAVAATLAPALYYALTTDLRRRARRGTR
jgi:hypothetical protein